MPLHSTKRSIFPVLLDRDERRLLRELATECGLPQTEIMRQLMLKEFASRLLSRLRPMSEEAVAGK